MPSGGFSPSGKIHVQETGERESVSIEVNVRKGGKYKLRMH